MTELIIANKDTGKIWEISNSVESVELTFNRTGSPGELSFSVIKAGELSFFEGDVVRFSKDGQLLFYGWVFTKSKDRWGVIEVTCYDRLRYLKASASYAFYNQSAGDIISQIAADFQIEVGTIEDTGYLIPSLVEEEQTCLDIISEAVQQTLLNTGKVYVFYDDGSGLCLREAANMRSDVVIGTQSLLTEYDYKTDIDEQTYNSIKLARGNEDTGRADVFIATDSENIGRWGLLQLYQSVDGDVNDAQMAEQAKTMLEYYNRRQRELSFTALGVDGLRAGQLIYMNVPGLGDIDLDQWVMIEKITHTYENGVHEMDVDTLSI